MVYSGASTEVFNGNLPPTRTIITAALSNPLGINFGANDDLYVANNGAIMSWSVAPDFTLTVNPAVGLNAIAVDLDDTGYIVNNGANAVYSYDGISTLNSALNPDRTIQGAATQLFGPIRFFLIE